VEYLYFFYIFNFDVIFLCTFDLRLIYKTHYYSVILNLVISTGRDYQLVLLIWLYLYKLFSNGETSQSSTPARDVFLAVTDAQPRKHWSKMLQSQNLTWLPGKGKEAQTSAWWRRRKHVNKYISSKRLTA
jgi:hypothetical protein